MLFNSYVVVEFCYIRKPFLIWCFGCKFTVKYIFSNELRIGRLSGTTIVGIFNRRFYSKTSADTQNSFVISIYAMISFQLISNSAVAFVRRFVMDFFYQCCNPFVFQLTFRYFTIQPFIVSCSGYSAQLAKSLYRIVMFLMFFLNCLIY